MPSQSPPSALRADAARNRELIIAAAAAVFAERGLDAATAEIAHRAGVGEATLFRRFPTKDDLIDAIIETRMEELAVLADAAADAEDPAAALERFMQDLVKQFSRDKGFFEAAGERCVNDPKFQSQRERGMEAVGRLLRRAQDAGAVRTDLSPADISFLAGSAMYAMEVRKPGLRDDLWKRYLRVILDGMKPEGASKLRP
ncbi:MAG TPA: helix-turn-helix domain-containing protein, partial [Thermoleophilaceae bacterium]|nr:helix-turn-helix domain-containing protein [Thermoleophilaceae bacterium]